MYVPATVSGVIVFLFSFFMERRTVLRAWVIETADKIPTCFVTLVEDFRKFYQSRKMEGLLSVYGNLIPYKLNKETGGFDVIYQQRTRKYGRNSPCGGSPYPLTSD
ncbi:uncharacterized protein LOC143213870 [Lasioglossum baleicum]|uniref:uncharacterized protein LOC143213870 n=1 Tax=Lasioglossum baleicum TaxID=434251 RepID=UPI003FCDAD1B